VDRPTRVNKTGEKSNQCKECDFVSSQANNLTRHLKKHSGKSKNITNTNLPSLVLVIWGGFWKHTLEKSQTNVRASVLQPSQGYRHFGPRTAGPRGPNVRLQKMESWAPGPNCPLSKSGQLSLVRQKPQTNMFSHLQPVQNALYMDSQSLGWRQTRLCPPPLASHLFCLY